MEEADTPTRIHDAMFALQTASIHGVRSTRIHFLGVPLPNSHSLRHSEHRTVLPVPLSCSAKHLHYVGSFNQGALTEHFPRLTFCRCTLKAPKTILRFKSDPSRPYQAARLKPCGAQDDGLAIILHFALCILHCAAARSAQDDGLITILHFAFYILHCAAAPRAARSAFARHYIYYY